MQTGDRGYWKGFGLSISRRHHPRRWRHQQPRWRDDAALPLLAGLGHGTAVTRRRAILVVTAFVAGGIAVLVLRDPVIDAAGAQAIADRMAGDFQRRSGHPAAEFHRRETRQWADGWEFRWRFKPCPDTASLRVWISRSGRRAAFAELPDCTAPQANAPQPA